MHTHKSKVSSCHQGGHANPLRHRSTRAIIRRYQPVLVNPPGGGLVPHRWGSTMPRVMVWALKVPPGPRPLADTDSSLTFASQVTTRYLLMLQLSGLLPQLTPGPHLNSLGRLEHCKQSFLLKKTLITTTLNIYADTLYVGQTIRARIALQM